MPRAPERVGQRAGFLDWMFRSRTTGRITLAQPPNWPLVVWFLASATMWVGQPQGRVRDFLVILTSSALARWAGGEVWGGVNPFRRLLGLAVLGWLIISVVRWLTT